LKRDWFLREKKVARQKNMKKIVSSKNSRRRRRRRRRRHFIVAKLSPNHKVMGLCASKPTTTVGRSKYTKSNSAVVRDARSGKLTRVNGGSLKALGNALFFPVRFRSFRVFVPRSFN